MARPERRSFDQPDEIREFPNGRAEVVNIGGGQVMRMTLAPGWRWSADVKPAAGTELCEAPHFQVVLSGRLGVRMADGEELQLGPGDVNVLPSGHDAWVIGGEPAVAVDWGGAHVWGVNRATGA